MKNNPTAHAPPTVPDTLPLTLYAVARLKRGPCGFYLLFRSVLTLRSRYARTRLRQCEPGLRAWVLKQSLSDASDATMRDKEPEVARRAAHQYLGVVGVLEDL